MEAANSGRKERQQATNVFVQSWREVGAIGFKTLSAKVPGGTSTIWLLIVKFKTNSGSRQEVINSTPATKPC